VLSGSLARPPQRRSRCRKTGEKNPRGDRDETSCAGSSCLALPLIVDRAVADKDRAVRTTCCGKCAMVSACNTPLNGYDQGPVSPSPSP
jgi:hypothetical protein